MSTRVLSNLPPRARQPLPVVRHHHVEAGGFDLHVLEWPAPEVAPCAVLLLPAAGGHAGMLGVLASELRARGCRVLGLDPPGHGQSSGARGAIPMQPTVDAIATAAEWTAQHTRLPVALLGTGLGAHWALHAHLRCDAIHATVCHALRWPSELRMRLARSWAVDTIARRLGPLPVPLHRVEPRRQPRREHTADALALSGYSLEAWRTFSTTAPTWPPASNHKPVLLVVGERDEAVTPAEALRCYMALGGPKAFHVVAGAAHDLAHENAPALADAAADFLAHLPT